MVREYATEWRAAAGLRWVSVMCEKKKETTRWTCSRFYVHPQSLHPQEKSCWPCDRSAVIGQLYQQPEQDVHKVIDAIPSRVEGSVSACETLVVRSKNCCDGQMGKQRVRSRWWNG